MMDNRKKDDPAEPKAGAARPKTISRRGLLKAGATAMPAVLTMQSGAAMAATSAYIGTVSLSSSEMAGHVHCLDVRNAEPLPGGTTFRFVGTDYADVYMIPDGHYYPTKGRSGDYELADGVCRSGGTKYLDASGWPEVKLPSNMNGVLVSSTALMSIEAALDIKRIPLP